MQVSRSRKYWLSLVSVGLVLSFSVVLAIQFRQTRLLENAIELSESEVSWGVFQLEREAQNFQLGLKTALATPDDEQQSQLHLRYDIFWSRFDVIVMRPQAQQLLASAEYDRTIEQLARFFERTEQYFPPAASPRLTRDELKGISVALDPVLLQIHALANLSIHRAVGVSEQRNLQIRDQIRISTLLVLFQLVLTLTFFAMTIRLVRKLQASHDDLTHMATFDQLSGLPNRRLFYDRLEREIRVCERSGKRLALMYIDLDNFKDINDTQGHDVGDALLKEAAQRLLRSVRRSDTVARLGGDEFTVILPGLESTSAVARIAEAVLTALREPFPARGRSNFVSASIGITVFPDDAQDVHDLLRQADQAMYEAKKFGRNRYHYFTPDMQAQAQARMQRIGDLRLALSRRELCLRYQPIVDLRSGKIRKAEALVRWQHPSLGLLSPQEFIPLAEETGLIVELGNWICEQALEQTASWRRTLDPAFQISINTSPVQLCDNGTRLDAWLTWLDRLQLPGSALALEITESILMSEAASERLLAIQSMGLEVSLDDFGTGYSTLSYLKKFDIDYLKIDRSFVQSLSPGSSDFVLCEAIILMAHKLGIQVVAEGIETDTQHRYLVEMGCDYGQGYRYSKPVSADEFERLVAGIHRAGNGN
ncbi:putative bifunctional diguanylate cyclase/phosphodiesterase [Marinobacterium nitratireducens]|nr:EAL domain-containing protein [Marinobacterium nitratireducens]